MNKYIQFFKSDEFVYKGIKYRISNEDDSHYYLSTANNLLTFLKSDENTIYKIGEVHL